MNRVFVHCAFLFFSSAVSAQFHIILDPGHGGADKGAVRDSFAESKIVLAIAQKLKLKLNELRLQNVTLTRDRDVLVSLKDRVKIAEESRADVFISLHANTSTLPTLSGMEFYFNSTSAVKKEPAVSATRPTAAEVVAKIKDDFSLYEKTHKSLLLSKTFQESTSGDDARGIIRRAPFYVIENTPMPSVLIELGFISNRREAKKLSSDEYQNQIVERIAQALIEYKNKSDKAPPL